MSEPSNRDKTLTPYDQVARMYSLRNPHDPISPERAQAIGVAAIMKLKAKMKSEAEGKYIQAHRSRFRSLELGVRMML